MMSDVSYERNGGNDLARSFFTSCLATSHTIFYATFKYGQFIRHARPSQLTDVKLRGLS